MFPRAFDWIKTSEVEIQRMLDWPFEGFWFDVRENELWWHEWGAKPKSALEQKARLAEVFADTPKLIPLSGHRYLPEKPAERGNPVLSVHQSDVIYYGANLSDWFKREAVTNGDWTGLPPLVAKEIPFWSEAVRRNA